MRADRTLVISLMALAVLCAVTGCLFSTGRLG
jgi:predicted small lipoprotein YifL